MRWKTDYFYQNYAAGLMLVNTKPEEKKMSKVSIYIDAGISGFEVGVNHPEGSHRLAIEDHYCSTIDQALNKAREMLLAPALAEKKFQKEQAAKAARAAKHKAKVDAAIAKDKAAELEKTKAYQELCNIRNTPVT